MLLDLGMPRENPAKGFASEIATGAIPQSNEAKSVHHQRRSRLDLGILPSTSLACFNSPNGFLANVRKAAEHRRTPRRGRLIRHHILLALWSAAVLRRFQTRALAAPSRAVILPADFRLAFPDFRRPPRVQGRGVDCFIVRFPPPIRITAPLLALAFGLVATFLDYRLNLAFDLNRHLKEVRARADASGHRLARTSERLIGSGKLDLLQAEMETMPDLPDQELVGLIDEKGVIIADSSGTLHGKPVALTPLAPAAKLAARDKPPMVEQAENEAAVLRAIPFRLGESETGWALLII